MISWSLTEFLSPDQFLSWSCFLLWFIMVIRWCCNFAVGLGKGLGEKGERIPPAEVRHSGMNPVSSTV